MTTLRAAPDLLAAVIAMVPARIVKRLDAKRDVARGWTWSVTPEGGTVVTEGGETVTVRATSSHVAEASHVTCSCLLSPRCFHVLAVVAALDVDDAPAPQDAPSEGTPPAE